MFPSTRQLSATSRGCARPPSWQLLTSAANLGRLPARERGEQQGKSGFGVVTLRQPLLRSQQLLTSAKPSQPHRLTPGRVEPVMVSRLSVRRSRAAQGAVLSLPQLRGCLGLQARQGIHRHLDSQLTPSPAWGCRESRRRRDVSQSSQPGLGALLPLLLCCPAPQHLRIGRCYFPFSRGN